jgi:predicted membrane channel-forming protein YqfA (hemolysin III family)
VDLAKILPMAFVMVAGPQIISAFFFATSESWAKASAAYVFGAALSITAVTSAAYFLANGASSSNGDSGLNGIDYAVLALLLFAAIHTYRDRNQSEPPKWMGRLQTVTPKATFVLGFLLLGFFPSDIVTSITVGSFLGNRGDSWLEILPFVAFTLLLLGLPALLVAALGNRAKELLPKARDWMHTNSWIVSEIVIALFIVIILLG